MAEPLATTDSVFVHLLFHCIENHSTNKWICTKFVDSKKVSKTRKHRSNLAVGFFIAFMLRNSKKSIPGANTTAVLVSCKSVLVEETTIFTMLYFFFYRC